MYHGQVLKVLQAIPADEFAALAALAVHIDSGGRCCPSQTLLAQHMGVTRPTANQRLQRLLQRRLDGQPLVTATTSRRKSVSTGKGGERWASTEYRLTAASGFGFGPDPMSLRPDTGSEPVSTATDIGSGPVSAQRDTGNVLLPRGAVGVAQEPMSSEADTRPEPVSSEPVSGSPDTNKNQSLTRLETAAPAAAASAVASDPAPQTHTDQTARPASLLPDEADRSQAKGRQRRGPSPVQRAVNAVHDHLQPLGLVPDGRWYGRAAGAAKLLTPEDLPWLLHAARWAAGANDRYLRERLATADLLTVWRIWFARTGGMKRERDARQVADALTPDETSLRFDATDPFAPLPVAGGDAR